MLEENKNLKSQIKDIKDNSSFLAPYKNESFHLMTYNKTNKLISALYMVTDIMDKDEPLRNKLRNSGIDIISDIHSIDKGQDLFNQINKRVSEVLSFIEIASSVNIISEMNSSILIKEFIELRKSIIEATPKKSDNWLKEFIYENEELENNVSPKRFISMGHHKVSPQKGMSIGVQKGGTLLHALSRVQGQALSRLGGQAERNRNESIDVLKNKRREEIILIIKDKMKDSINFNGLTITDIKSKGLSDRIKYESLVSCGEKTLQRELISMVSAGILKKTGEKRWSKYSLS